jgi:diaminopimelate epimerase
VAWPRGVIVKYGAAGDLNRHNTAISMPKRIPFTKMSGSGNDFVVIDNRADVIAPEEVREFTRHICRHRISVGADGVVLIEQPQTANVSGQATAHFRWRYINADGSDGEMCGNGAMCGARFAYLNGIAPAECVFQTPSGLVSAHVDLDPGSPWVRLDMVTPGPIRTPIDLAIAGYDLRLHPLTVGVPHAVLVADDADAFAPGVELRVVGRAVRMHSSFAPEGTNLNVISILDRHRLRMRTYERGVEDETLACGTGAVASAVIATRLGLVEPPVDVVTSSGRTLEVDFTWDGDRASAVTLGGEGRVIATGEIWPEALG